MLGTTSHSQAERDSWSFFAKIKVKKRKTLESCRQRLLLNEEEEEEEEDGEEEEEEEEEEELEEV